MRVLLKLSALTLAVAVALGGYGGLPLALGLVVAGVVFDDLVDDFRRWHLRRRLFVSRGYELPIDDIAPHLRALRSSARDELQRADELVGRFSPDDCVRLARAGAQADVALRNYVEARLELAALVEVGDARPDPQPPPPMHAPPPRVRSSSFVDEATGPTRGFAS